MRIKFLWSILQHNVVRFDNRVFGMGTWNLLAVKEADGEGRLKSVYADLWINGQVPWKGGIGRGALPGSSYLQPI